MDVVEPHPVLTRDGLVRVAGELARGGWAVRELPDLQHIEVDPDRHSGRPVIRGKRVAAEDAGRLALADDRTDVSIEGYGLTLAEIDDARAWWTSVERYEAS